MPSGSNRVSGQVFNRTAAINGVNFSFGTENGIITPLAPRAKPQRENLAHG
jgi:hypothetical protein